jgi:ribulose-phosphate 3-epimerase
LAGNTNKIKVSASILAGNFKNLEREIEKIEKSGAEEVHLDIMDGHFVPNLTYGAPVVKDLRPLTNLIFDAHLMLTNPENYITDFKKAGADILTIHAELENALEIINSIKMAGLKSGIALKPNTQIEDVDDNVWKEIDRVLVMAVEPGFSGQKHIDQTEKIHDLRILLGKKADISIDGGINEVTAPKCIKAGANILVSGNYLFKAANMKNAVEKLRNNS